ncbi:MAG: AMP-binding protein [Acidimicrobiales bacterium]
MSHLQQDESSRGGVLAHTTADQPSNRLDALFEQAPGARIAFVSPEHGRSLTYAQAAEHVVALSGQLAAAGVRRGDRVAISMPNSPEFVELLFAVTRLGAAAAPLNPAYTEAEYDFYLGDIAPRLVLLASKLPAAERVASALRIPVIKVTERKDGPPALSLGGNDLGERSTYELGEPEDVAIVLHTSGTTSRPKQVPLLQQNLMASIHTIAVHYELGSEDVSFCVMPLFHVHGLVASALATIHQGGTVILPRRFTPHRFWRQARMLEATWFSAAPTLHQMILERVDVKGAPSTFRFVRSCSSALSPALMERAESIYGVPVLEAYGMTEASHQVASNPLPPKARIPGSVGAATGTEVAVIDQQSRFQSEGVPGEIVIRGPGVTPGYLNNQSANTESFFDGWFRTGDRGVLRAGYLHLEGRIKEMILRGGETIAPAEIEAVLLQHPAVDEAICFGVADDKYGEVPTAAVTLSTEADPKTLVDFCRQRLAAFKVPKTIHVVAKIPRTPTGKVQRRLVAAAVDNRERGS